jgi:hypothetical protein
MKALEGRNRPSAYFSADPSSKPSIFEVSCQEETTPDWSVLGRNPNTLPTVCDGGPASLSTVTSRREKALDFSGCNSRPGTGSLHPVAIEAAAEATKLSELSM